MSEKDGFFFLVLQSFVVTCQWFQKSAEDEIIIF